MLTSSQLRTTVTGQLVRNHNHVWRPSKAIKGDILFMKTLYNNSHTLSMNCQRNIFWFQDNIDEILDPFQMLPSVY